MFTIYQILRTARPRQWLKNLSVFAPAFFAGTIVEGDVFVRAFWAFIIFCALSSGIYFLNDVVDVDRDRQHPIKKNRPIASGKLSEGLAWAVSFILIIGSVFCAYFLVGSYFFLTLVFYVLMQISYSLYFRNVIIMDSLIVAAGFVFRVFSGGFASNTSISSWLALTTIGISLLLAFGKRRSEKTIVGKIESPQPASSTRATLRHYPDTLLDSMISISAAYTLVTYSFFTFQISSQFTSQALSAFLPSILRSPKWMMLTIPFVLYGVARYLYVIYEKGEGESPERVLLSDRPLLLSVVLWGFTVLSIIYILPFLA